MLKVKCYKRSDEYIPHDLTVGEMYDVLSVHMGSWKTDVELVGKEMPYNSVIFQFFEDDKEVNIYADPKYNPYL